MNRKSPLAIPDAEEEDEWERQKGEALVVPQPPELISDLWDKWDREDAEIDRLMDEPPAQRHVIIKPGEQEKDDGRHDEDQHQRGGRGDDRQ